VAANQVTERLSHRREVELARHVPGVPPEERVGDRSRVHEVRVALAEGGAPGVETAGRLAHVEDADVAREPRVERAVDRLRCQRGGRRQRRRLAEGVHPGVGARGADDARGRVEGVRGAQQRALDGRARGLHLPAAVLGAVVRQHQPEGGPWSYRGGERWRPARTGTSVSQTIATSTKSTTSTRTSKLTPVHSSTV